MTFNERVTASKPYVTGIIIGLIAAPIIGFSAGWITTSGARADAVASARIDTLASLCFSSAERLTAAQNGDLAALKGYQNREKREAMVSSVMDGLQVPGDLAKQVASSCNRNLA